MSGAVPSADLDVARPGRRFAFNGRVSTEDNQDPEASYNWQKSRSRSLIEPVGGIIVAEYFDVGQSRSLPWKRRPRAAQLLADLADPGRGFDAVVIGEPQRAFYGNQYSLVMPVFTHYGVQLWVPEVGGPVDPDSEAHDLIMSVFGGLSKGERNRVRLRVRAAMSAQAALEGRFLGGRPPYGYRLADAGPHPNPAKAADGKRLHKLEPHPDTAWVVRRIFAEYLAGRGLFAIAEGLTRDQIASPSQHDRARNQHRTGEGWSKSAVRVILTNPRYTGRQVWNKQRKDEILLDVNDVAAGYETRMRWNQPGSWVWSDAIAHEPLINARTSRTRRPSWPTAGGPGAATARRTSGSPAPTCCAGGCTAGTAAAGCRASTATRLRTTGAATQRNTPWPAMSLIPATSTSARPTCCPSSTGGWRSSSLRTASSRPSARCKDSRTQPVCVSIADDTQALIADCDARLARYQAALDAGADPQAVAEWTRQVKNERAAALARDTSQNRQPAIRLLTEDDIRALITGLGDLRDVIHDAAAAVKAVIYAQLGLKVTYLPGQDKIRADVTISPEIFAGQADKYGVMGRVRGGT